MPERRRVRTVRGTVRSAEAGIFVVCWSLESSERRSQYFCCVNILPEGIRRSYGEVPEWTKGADCKSVAIGFQGSNPCLPTKRSILDSKCTRVVPRDQTFSGNRK